MPFITSVDVFQKLAKDKRNEGRSFRVTKAVFDHFATPLRAKTSVIGKDEAEAIECLLGMELNLDGAGLTRDCKCTHCNHTLSLADHVASAILSGAHSSDELVKILGGPSYWLTIDTDQLRVIICPRCYREFAAIHCCYTYSNYAYA